MEQGNVSTNRQFKSADWVTILLYLALITIGWFSIVGATYNYGDPISLDFASRAGKQLLWIALALVWAFAIMLSSERIYDVFCTVFYIAMMGLLLVTPFLATNHKGSYSWISLGPVSLQPAEFAKTATALALAKTMGVYDFNIKKTKHLIRALLIIFVPFVLIIMERETGSALVYLAFFLVFYREGMSGSVLFVGMAAIVYFVVGVRFNIFELAYTHTSLGRFWVMLLIWLFTIVLVLIYDRRHTYVHHLLIGGGTIIGLAWLVSRFIVPFDISYAQLAVCIGCASLLIFEALFKRKRKLYLIALFTVSSLAIHYSTDYVLNSVLKPHQQTRIRVLLGLEQDINGAGYNVRQSMIAIGSGGFSGKGFLNGTQTKLNYVPEQDTDFIFCTIGEETGFVGSSIVLLLFLALILRLIHLAERQEYASGRIYGYCVLSILLFHLFINIGMVMGITPVIGIPLPFFSYGGSSLWGFTILLFIFLRMDRGGGKNEEGNEKWRTGLIG